MFKRLFDSALQFAMRLLLAAVLLSGTANATLILQTAGVVLDTDSGLEWEEIASHGNPSWYGAVDYAAKLNLDGGGWRLPTRIELTQLREAACPGMILCDWTATPFLLVFDYYWSADQVNATEAYVCPAFISQGISSCFPDGKDIERHYSAWAVRDVAVPGTGVLLALGIAALGVSIRKRAS